MREFTPKTENVSHTLDNQSSTSRQMSIPVILQAHANHTLGGGSVPYKYLEKKKNDIPSRLRGFAFADNRPLQARQAAIQASIVSSAHPHVIQRNAFDMRGTSVAEIVTNQYNDQTELASSAPADHFTTVGFEYEFAQFNFAADSLSPLVDATHVELGHTNNVMPFTHLPFYLETDSGNTIELVTPPFLIQTVGSRSIPNPDYLQSANDKMKSTLNEVVPPPSGSSPSCPFGIMLNQLNEKIGWPFQLNNPILMNSSNINPRTPSAPPISSKPETRPLAGFSPDVIINEETIASRKAGQGNISEQINFATEASVYHDLKMADSTQRFGRGLPPTPLTAAFTTLENSFKDLFRKSCSKTVYNNPIIYMFFDEMARNFSQCVALPASDMVEDMKKQVFVQLLKSSGPAQTRNKKFQPRNPADIEKMDSMALQAFGVDKKQADLFTRAANIRSCVKDIHGVWLKDHLMNFANSLLQTPENINHVFHMLQRLNDSIIHIPVSKELKLGTINYGQLFKQQLDMIISYFSTPQIVPPYVPVAFGQNNPLLPGARHDTLLDFNKVNHPVGFQHENWHVAEVRDNPIDRIRYVAGLEKP